MMPTLAQVRNRIDTWLSDRWSTVQARQDSYFDTHGRYWQGLRSHTLDVEHSTLVYGDTPADRMANKPSDQTESWVDVFTEMAGISIPMVFWFDVYNSPRGHGYVVTVWAKYNGTVYSRSQNVGPLSERTRAWHEVTDAEGT